MKQYSVVWCHVAPHGPKPHTVGSVPFTKEIEADRIGKTISCMEIESATKTTATHLPTATLTIVTSLVQRTVQYLPYILTKQVVVAVCLGPSGIGPFVWMVG